MIFKKPIVQIYVFEVPPKQTKFFLEDWKQVEADLQQNSSLVSAILHKEKGKSPYWLIYILWKSEKARTQAISQGLFKELVVNWNLEESPIYIPVNNNQNIQPFFIRFLKKITSANVILITAWLLAIVFAIIVLILRK